MESSTLRSGFRRAIKSSHSPARRRVQQPRRNYATPANTSSSDSAQQAPIRAAPKIRFDSGDNTTQSRAELLPSTKYIRSPTPSQRADATKPPRPSLLSRLRVLPASPSYFTATPRFTDDILHLSALYRKYGLIPTAEPGNAPRVAWKTWQQYRTELGEPVKTSAHKTLIGLLKRLNNIHPSLFPYEVEHALKRFKRTVQPNLNAAKPIVVDEDGRARAVGRRKTSHAVVYLVEGNGECLVNSRPLHEYFVRLHDRESALWALKATDRLGNYNVWAKVNGGGTTGQAEAVMLGVSRALRVFEPGLKPALRKAGVVARDPREVERKKPGKLKARKMPAWVKR